MADTRMLVPVAHLAKLFNLTERRCQQLAADGIIPKSERGKYHLVESVIGYVKFLQERAYGKSETLRDSHSERTRLIMHKANLAELEHAERTGALISAEGVYSQDFQIGHILKTNLLSIADRVSAVLAAETCAAACHKVIYDEVNESLLAAVENMHCTDAELTDMDITRRAAAESLNAAAEFDADHIEGEG